MKKGFTLMELIIVVAIIAIASVFSFSAFRANITRATFDDAVSDVIAVFQEARGYSIKNVEIDGDINEIYTVSSTSAVVTISGDISGTITTYDLSDRVSFDYDWEVYYEAPYGDFSTSSGSDLEFTITAGDLSQDIIVHKLSGIAEKT